MTPKSYTTHYQIMLNGDIYECSSYMEADALIWFYIRARYKIALLSGWKQPPC